MFCVDDAQPSSSGKDLDKFLYYGENELGSAAIVEVGANPDVMQKRGWLHIKTSHFQFRPVALHSWLAEAKPMPLITKVSATARVTIGSLHHREQCKGGKIGGGNYNEGFDKNPFIYLCVEYSEPEALFGRNVVADDQPYRMYVSDLHLQEVDYKVKDGKCLEGMEAVANNPSVWFSLASTPFKFAGHETTYFLLCLTKSRAVIDGGDDTRIAESRFLSCMFVDEQKERPMHISAERNDAIDWLAYGDAKNVRLNSIFESP